DDAITLREAAAVMDRILNVADVELDDLVKAEATWSTQAVANMVSVHVVSAGSFGTETESAPVTRAEAAQILTAALQVLEEQEDSGGLLGWLWGSGHTDDREGDGHQSIPFPFCSPPTAPAAYPPQQRRSHREGSPTRLRSQLPF